MQPLFQLSPWIRWWLFGLAEGVVFAALVINVRDALREDAFFDAIAVQAIGDKTGEEDRVLALMHKTHRMLAPIRAGMQDGSLEDVSGLDNYRRVLFDNVTHDVFFPRSECASYSGVLVKLLRSHSIPVRFGQMLETEDVTSIAHHIVVEAWLDGRWVILDPLYDLVFRGNDGRILGFDEIKRDWVTLKSQCPPDYDMRYDFRSMRRVNFGKLNPWPQKTPLAEWSVRTFLNEGAWLRVALAALTLVFVFIFHTWYERKLTGERGASSLRSIVVTTTAKQPRSINKA